MNLDALAAKYTNLARPLGTTNASREKIKAAILAALAQAYREGQEEMRERAKIAVNRSASKAEAELSVESLEVKP